MIRQLKISPSITNRETGSVERYLRDIQQYPLLAAEDEVILAKKIHAGDTKALDTLVNANLRFVVSVAKQYQGNGLSLLDLVSEGNIGLIQAAKKYDESKGFKFVSYAVWWIRQSILKGIADHVRLVRLPMNKTGLVGKIINEMNRIALENEYNANPDDIAEALGLTREQIEEASQYLESRYVSLDMPTGHPADDGNQIVLDTIKSEEEAYEMEMDLEILRTDLLKIAKKILTERQYKAVCMFYGFENSDSFTLEQMGRRMGTTGEACRHLLKLAVKRFRKSKNVQKLIRA